jgi:hypothetical protein
MTKPTAPRTPLMFRPKPDVVEAIRAMAAEDRRPVSQFLAIMAEDFIARRKAKAERRKQTVAA